MLEVRGLWVTRFDWTDTGGADPARVDEMVEQTPPPRASTHSIFRFACEGDAYYSQGWSRGRGD